MTGIDSAERLVAVARRRATAERAQVDFSLGDIQSLPFRDATYDVALSVFGVIFALDAEAAFDEMVRILRPGGRAVVSAWVPGNDPLGQAVGVYSRAVSEAAGTDPPHPRFPWHDDDAVRALVERRFATIRFHHGALVVEADSPEDYLAMLERHPMSVSGMPALERAGVAERVRSEVLGILRDGNEEPSHFRTSRPYRLIELQIARVRHAVARA